MPNITIIPKLSIILLATWIVTHLVLIAVYAPSESNPATCYGQRSIQEGGRRPFCWSVAPWSVIANGILLLTEVVALPFGVILWHSDAFGGVTHAMTLVLLVVCSCAAIILNALVAWNQIGNAAPLGWVSVAFIGLVVLAATICVVVQLVRMVRSCWGCCASYGAKMFRVR